MTPLRLALATFIAALATAYAVQRCPCVGGGSFRVALVWQKPLDSASSLFPFWRDGRLGFINPDGEIVIAAQFHADPNRFEGFRDGLARVSEGTINEAGELVATPEPVLLNDRSMVSGWDSETRSSYRYYVDRSGNTVFRLDDAAEVQPFSDGLAAFRAPTRWIDFDLDERRFMAYPGA